VAQEETSLSDMVDTISRRWRLVVAVALSLVVGATLYAERQPLRYEASAIVVVTPRVGQSSADLVRVSAPRFAAYLTAAATLRKVAARLGEDAEGLPQQVNATIIPDTGNITITVQHLDPRRAMTVANELVGQVRRASAPDRLVVVQSLAPAVLPTSPAGPPRRLIEAAALVVGLLLGVGLAALVDAVQERPARSHAPGEPPPPSGAVGAGPVTAGAAPPAPRPRHVPDSGSGLALAELGRYPVVGDLPCSPALRTSVTGALTDPAVDKAVGALTANLTRPLGRDVRGTIVVTSPSPHQGKTTVARLLAASRLRSGARVLRVDGHKEDSEVLRPRNDHENGRPSTSPGQEKHHETGLNRIKDLWAIEDGMWVLPAAHDPVAVALTDGQEAEILAEARTMFDCIIVDAPLVLDHDESQVSVSQTLIPLADAVLLVISPDSTVELLYRSIETFRDVPGPFVGVVLNRVREATGAGGSSNVRQLKAPPFLEDAGGQ
jgi:Mrp family chromosome partitioning ATPase/capsular polysaccharide biosynthesis protein